MEGLGTQVTRFLSWPYGRLLRACASGWLGELSGALLTAFFSSLPCDKFLASEWEKRLTELIKKLSRGRSVEDGGGGRSENRGRRIRGNEAKRRFSSIVWSRRRGGGGVEVKEEYSRSCLVWDCGAGK